MRIRSRDVAGVIRGLWVALSIVVLVYGQAIYDGKPNRDVEEVVIILMFILSFPASFVAGAIAVGVAFSFERLMHSPLHTTRLEMLFTWALFFAVGYVQWFMLVPRVWSKWQTFRMRKHAQSPELKRPGLA